MPKFFTYRVITRGLKLESMGSTVLWILLIFGSAVDGRKLEETCETMKDVNGCSTPLWLPAPYKKVFDNICNRHDVCYHCVCISVLLIFRKLMKYIVLSFLENFDPPLISHPLVYSELSRVLLSGS